MMWCNYYWRKELLNEGNTTGTVKMIAWAKFNLSKLHGKAVLLYAHDPAEISYY